jgi:hypothetical protein
LKQGATMDPPRQREHKKKSKKSRGSDDTASRASEDDEERRLRKELRRAKKMARHLERLELDENQNETNYPVRECKFTILGMTDKVAINPAVTLIAVSGLWAIAIWCSGKLDESATTESIQLADASQHTHGIDCS